MFTSFVERMLLHIYPSVNKNIDKMPLIAVLHHIIGRGAKCREEKHVEVIKELEERLRIATKIAAAYLRKYGKIRPEKT